MQRYLSLDLGKKRTGIALVDSESKVATPIAVISHETHTDEFLNDLYDLVIEWEPVALIIGLPIDLKGKHAVAAKDVESRTQKILKNINSRLLKNSKDELIVHFVDERLTTAQAERSMQDFGLGSQKRKELRDALAAAVIAQSWVDTL